MSVPVVCVLNSVAFIKSTGRLSFLIAQGTKASYNNCFAFGRYKKQSKVFSKTNKTIEIGSKVDVLFHIIGTKIFDLHGFFSKKATQHFLRSLEKINPDILHIHNLHGYYINVEMLFKWIKQRNQKVIYTMHDFWAISGHCANSDPVGCEKYLKGCEKCPLKKAYPQSLFLDNCSKNWQRKNKAFGGVKTLFVVAVSNYSKTKLEQTFFSQYPISVVPNAVDLCVFKPYGGEQDEKTKALLGVCEKFLLLGVATKFSAQKGFEDFLLLSKMIPADFVIVLVGVSKKQKKALPKNIIGVSETHDVKWLAKIYSSADVFVNPTQSETFSLTTLESICAGVPVVANGVGGVNELVGEKRGHVVESGNVAQMYEKIMVVKQRGKSFYFNDCIAFAKKYSLEKMQQRYLNLYDRLQQK